MTFTLVYRASTLDANCTPSKEICNYAGNVMRHQMLLSPSNRVYKLDASLPHKKLVAAQLELYNARAMYVYTQIYGHGKDGCSA